MTGPRFARPQGRCDQIGIPCLASVAPVSSNLHPILMTQFFLLHTVASSRAATTRWPLCPCTMRGIVRCSWFDRRAAVRHPPPPAPPEDAQLDSSHGPQPRTHSSTVPRPCQAASLASGEARSSAPGPAETRGVVQSSSAASACLEHGSLFVHLLGAQKLKASGRNPNGKSDPYAILLLAGQRAKSKTVKASLNPLWDETFEFVGVRGELLTQSLQLRILDWDERTDGRTDGWDGASSAADDWLQNNNNLGQASLRLEPLLHVHALLPGTTKQALGGRRSLSMVKLPALAAPQLDPSASSGRARRLWAARYTQSEAQPLGTPPPPQGLKRAASKVADSTAFDHPGPTPSALLPRPTRAPPPRRRWRVGQSCTLKTTPSRANALVLDGQAPPQSRDSQAAPDCGRLCPTACGAVCLASGRWRMARASRLAATSVRSAGQSAW